MKYLKRITIIVFCNFILAQDPIEVNPSTLDFGNVLMGNTPSMTFTLTANLSQTVTITPPTYYSLSDSSLTMTSGDSTIITVTFTPPPSFQVSIPEDTEVHLVIYDILGRHVKTLVRQTQAPGYKSVRWNGRNDMGQTVSAGMYFYRIQAGSFSKVQKMILLK